jgi:hypothetical protein
MNCRAMRRGCAGSAQSATVRGGPETTGRRNWRVFVVTALPRHAYTKRRSRRRVFGRPKSAYRTRISNVPSRTADACGGTLCCNAAGMP